MTDIDFYFAAGSRYSYLASTQLDAFAAECNCRFEWLPLNSMELMSLLGRNPFAGPPMSGQYEWPYRERDAKRWAGLYRVPFIEPRGRVEFDPGLLALACTAAKRLGHVERFSQELFAAMFVDPVTILGEAECALRASKCGIVPDEFTHALKDPETARELEATTARGVAAGVFGVPTFVVGDELFWGNDRLALLRAHLMQNRGRSET